ncbi:MAG TPA: tetratricopeptide repeat protein, partial [Thermoanaerobaculia bacterium]
AYVDEQVGRLLSAIDSTKTTVVVVGDHGESLGEHGELTHGLLVYQSTLHVPLILSVPGGEVREPLSTVDVAPTIAALAGLSLPEIDGRNISGGLRPDSTYGETEYPKTFGWSALTSIRRGNIKLIRGVRSEMFDLTRDPNETTNIIDTQRRLYGELARKLDDISKTAIATSSGTVDEETRSKLASLGYVAPGVNTKPSNKDPRDMAPLFRRYEEAKGAIPELQKLVAEDPTNSVFRSTLARAYKQSGALDRALTLYRQAVALAPSDPDAWYNLATALQEAGRSAEAKQVATEAEKLDPGRPDVHNVLGVALVESGDPAGAEAEFRKAIALDPRNARAYNNLGNVLRITGRAADAEAAYRKALEITPTYADALNGWGVIAVQQGDSRQAIARFDAALRVAPDFYEAQLNRAIALQVSGDREGASEELRRLLRRLPKGRAYDAQRTAARTLLGQLPPAR